MEKKLYIMITADIHPIGGMQLYTIGKAKFLEKNGWTVKIIYTGVPEGNCAIKDLNNYILGGFPYISFSPASYSKIERRIALGRIKKIILENNEKYDQIYIESQSDYSALWGELIASELQARHICFNCNELFRGDNKQYEKNMGYFLFKYDRNEIIGLRPDSLYKLFEGYREVPIDEKYMFDAVEPGPIQDVEDEDVNRIRRYDYNIMYLGRTEKGYFPNIVDGVVKFAKIHKQCIVQFIVVGNADARKEMINNLIKNEQNIILTLLGDKVPIPKSIYTKVDVVIAGAVCAEISARMNVPTIVADCENYLANGILGYTIDNSMYYDSQKGQNSFENELEDALIDKRYLKFEYSFPPATSSDNIYESQFCFYENASKKKEYYNVCENAMYRKRITGFFEIVMPIKFAHVKRMIKKINSRRIRK